MNKAAGKYSKDIQDKIYFYLLMSFGFCLILPRNFTVIILILLLLNWLVKLDFKNSFLKLINCSYFIVFILPFAILIIWLFGTDNFEYAFFKIEKSLALFIFPLVIFSSRPLQQNEYRKIFKAFILSISIGSIIAVLFALYKRYIVSGLTLIELNNFFIDIPLLYMSHIYFGYYVVTAVILTIYIYMTEPNLKTGTRTAIAILLLYLCVFIMLCAGLASFISILAVGLFLTIAYYSQINKRFLIAFALMATTIGCLVVLKGSNNTLERYKQRFNVSFKTIENNPYNYSSTRIGPLLAGLTIIKDNWFLGVGTGDTQDEMAVVYVEKGLDRLLGFNSHNQYLDFLMTFGIIGLFVLCLFYFYPLIKSLKLRQYHYTCFLFMIIICSITENILENNKCIFLLAFFNTLLASQMVTNNAAKHFIKRTI
ncbi:O-antigen ligase family protein [Pontibacter qinzhouensis]|nr:O-antigen ligase family protein [Pontibacter qinzhouensis]